jgi:hypothetical protein
VTDEKQPPLDEVSAESKRLDLKVVFEPIGAAPCFYVNHAEVARSLYDIGVILTRLPVKLSASDLASAKEKGELSVKPVVELVLPPLFVENLIAALQTQLAQFKRDQSAGGASGTRKEKRKDE